MGVTGANPGAVKNPCITLISQKFQSPLGIWVGLVSGPSADTKICRCVSSLYKMVLNNSYSWSFASVDFEPWIENTVFDPQVVECLDAKPRDTEDRPSNYGKKSTYKWTHAVQTCVGQGPTVL